MSRLTYMGQPVFAGRTRNETRPDFISCFALHIEECEQTGRNGSTANYRMAYRMLLRYAGGGQAASGTVHRRMARTLRAVAPGAGASGPIPSYSTCVPCGPFTTGPSNWGFFPAAGGNPFRRRLIRQVATRKRALPRETLRRIGDADLSALHPKYALARDLFMFSFYTRGMSFVDMIYLRKSDVRDGVLTYRRKKTGQMLSLRIEAPPAGNHRPLR